MKKLLKKKMTIHDLTKEKDGDRMTRYSMTDDGCNFSSALEFYALKEAEGVLHDK